MTETAMKSGKSLAWRITIALTALVSLTVALAAFLAFYAYREMEEGMIDKLIQTESARIVSRVSRFGDNWQKPFERDMGPSMYAWGETSELRAPQMPDALRDLPLGLHYLEQESSTWHVVVAEAMDGRLYVVYDSVMLEAQSRRFAMILLVIVLGCSAFAWAISHRVAKRLVAPLNALTDRLSRWVPGAPVAGIRNVNEADRLMEVFNRVQDQVDTSMANLREFSANLHHEVRTPLTVIRSDAELVLKHPGQGHDQVNLRLQRIIDSVDEIKQSLESTYNLAEQRMDERLAVNLRDCVEDVIDSLRLETGQAGLGFANLVRPDQQEELNLHALVTVVRNLLRNAMQHAAPATLTIESMPDGLQFTDSGAGIAANDLPYIFDRYFSNRRIDQDDSSNDSHGMHAHAADKAGLGLAIAKRVCLIQSWRLEVQSPVADGKGTRFVLRFQPEATLNQYP